MFQVYLRPVDNGKKHGQKISRAKHDVRILRQLFNGKPSSQQDEMSALITALHYMGGENLGRMDECENVNDRSPTKITISNGALMELKYLPTTFFLYQQDESCLLN